MSWMTRNPQELTIAVDKVVNLGSYCEISWSNLRIGGSIGEEIW